MKIAAYYPWVYLHGGPERTIAAILAHSRHEWTVLTNRYEPEATFPGLKSAGIIELPRVSVRRSFRDVSAAALRLALQKLPLEGHDALVVFCEGLGDLVLLRKGAIPAVCLCFTPLRAAFDAHYQREYLAHNTGRWWREPLLALYAAGFRAIDRRLWRRYDGIVAISGEVRRRIVEGRLASADVPVYYPGVDLPRFVPTGVYEPNFVIPGRIMWTKNLQLAIDAFRLFLARRPEHRAFTLTIAGYVDRKSESYYAMLRERASGVPQIRFVVAPADEELRTLCANAYATLYPPFNEDWGLVPLEAMALGKPVVAVNRGGPRESVVDGDTGYLVDPTPECFAAAIERLADDPALVRRLGARARARAAAFDWTAFCERLDTYLDVVVTRQADFSRARVPPDAAAQA